MEPVSEMLLLLLLLLDQIGPLFYGVDAPGFCCVQACAKRLLRAVLRSSCHPPPVTAVLAGGALWGRSLTHRGSETMYKYLYFYQ